MWAIRVVHCGIAPDDVWTTGTGIDFAQMLHNKSRKGWLIETEQMRKLMGHIYVVPNFTQKMCEMDSVALANYVMKTGRILA